MEFINFNSESCESSSPIEFNLWNEETDVVFNVPDPQAVEDIDLIDEFLNLTRESSGGIFIDDNESVKSKVGKNSIKVFQD